MSVRVPAEPCSECGYPLDAATFPTDDKVVPRAGDISICIGCGHMTAFTAEMRRRELTLEEMRDIASDPVMLRMQAARGKVMGRK